MHNTFDVMLIDGRNLLYRATWVNQALTHQRQPTGGIFGFLRTLLALQADFGGPQFEVCWEGRRNWRHTRYPGYKANRGKGLRDDTGFDVRAAVASQQSRVQDLLQLAGVPQWAPDDGECDDAIAVRTRAHVDDGLEVGIFSNDRDMYQLLRCPSVAVVRATADGYDTVRAADVEKELGVRPDQVVDLKALAGDTSDNIPGVPKIGPKKAAKLLKNHSLEQLLVAAASGTGWPGTPRQRELVNSHRDDVRMYAEVVALTDTTLHRVRERAPAEPYGLTLALEDLGMLTLANDADVNQLCDLGVGR